MRHLKVIAAAACAAALLVSATPAAAQDNFNRTTRITFSAPVELPTMTLPAGTYTFRLTDSTSDRHVVQVLDADGTKLVTMLHAMPARRAERSDVTVVTFRETAADAPAPLRFWYYPSDLMGHEFAYPRERAIAIANATGEEVLAIDGDQMTRVEPTAQATVTTPAPVVTPAPAPVTPPATQPQPVMQPEPQPAQPVTQPEPMPTAPTQMEVAGTSGELPATASPLPLVGLVGLIALGAGVGMRAVRRRSVTGSR